MLPLAAGIAALDAIVAQADVTPLLKWPNDILVADRKLGGILSELYHMESGRIIAIVGLGVNVLSDSFPDELSGSATSLSIETGAAPPLEGLAAHWIVGLENWCSTIEEGARQRVVAAWRERAEPFGRQVRVGDIEGRTVDLSDDGRLIVVTEDNERVHLAGGIVEHVGASARAQK
jgi:BirA family biotin operon repressor/biotin-[acetyl-CoA-carboxylase] ligase